MFALAAGLSIGCGSSSGTEPSGLVDSLSVVVKSSEWTNEKSLMVVGENASAQIEPLTFDGCPFGLWCPTPGIVHIRSSNPAVVGPAEQQVSAPASVTLLARAPGTTELTVRADTFTHVVHIEVSSEPLPLDTILIIRVFGPQENVTSIDLGAESGLFRLVALRGGAPVYGLRLIPASSSLEIVGAFIGCPLTRLWPQCRDDSRTMWLSTGQTTGGDAVVTVTGRNVVAHLAVHVPAPALGSVRPLRR